MNISEAGTRQREKNMKEMGEGSQCRWCLHTNMDLLAKQ